MDSPAPGAFGPGPFRHALPAGPIEGPAYSRPFRALTAAIVLGCAAGLAQLYLNGQLRGNSLLWSLAALSMMAWMGWHILRSRTRLSAEALHQGWVWDKHLPLQELSYARLIRLRGLDWLIAPRLYARTLGGKSIVFYTADPALMAEFARLQVAVQAHYAPR